MRSTVKEAAVALAIGGLRNTADSVIRLTCSAEFVEVMNAHQDKLEDPWIMRTSASNGTKDDAAPLSRPPAEAIEAARNLIMGYVGMNSSYMASNPKTKIHAPVWESWRAAARGPDHWAPS